MLDDQTIFLRQPTSIQILTLTLILKNLTAHVAFNKTFRACNGSGASEARQVFLPVRVKPAGTEGPVQANPTFQKQV